MKSKTILALGADIKNRFLIAKHRDLCWGPDLGDLGDAVHYERFKKEIPRRLKGLKTKPDIVACDLHPNYFSTKFAQSYTLYPKPYTLIPVQHHHAHIASVAEEHGLKGPTLGVSFDGTGYGSDGNIWGGEFLMVNKKGFKRLAHLKYQKMPGGERVIREPWRMAASILGEQALPFMKKVKKEEKEFILSMMAKDINSPLTSSAGRLFDAAAALLGICEYATFEAEGPIKLETLCDDSIIGSYAFGLSKDNGCIAIDTAPLFLDMVKDLRKEKRQSVIATKFHNTISDIIVTVTKKLSKTTGIKQIALSGGVFQNKFLMTKTLKSLRSLPLSVFINEKIPVNDLNIALGQYGVSRNASR